MEQLLRLKRLLEPGPRRPKPAERCEFCDAEVAAAHSHVVDLERRGLLCACRACFLLFTHPGAAGGRYRAVPDRYVRLEAALSGEQWDALQIPVGMAFLFHNSTLGRTLAFYPSPGGAMECSLPLETWAGIVAVNPALATVAPDVEALLVSRARGRSETYIVPIDACYELVGRVRRHWKGFDGGQEAWREIDAFFDSLRERGEEESAA